MLLIHSFSPVPHSYLLYVQLITREQKKNRGRWRWNLWKRQCHQVLDNCLYRQRNPDITNLLSLSFLVMKEKTMLFLSSLTPSYGCWQPFLYLWMFEGTTIPGRSHCIISLMSGSRKLMSWQSALSIHQSPRFLLIQVCQHKHIIFKGEAARRLLMNLLLKVIWKALNELHMT